MWTIIWLTLLAIAAYAGYRYFFFEKPHSTAGTVVEKAVEAVDTVVKTTADVNKDGSVDISDVKQAVENTVSKVKKTTAKTKPAKAKTAKL
jgi:hypothetical protein